MQKGTGSGDIAQKVGEGDERAGGEWEESGIDECSVRAYMALCVHNMDWTDGCVDGQTDRHCN